MMLELIQGMQAVLEVMIWGWGICQMQFCRNWRRWAVGIGVFLADEAFCLIRAGDPIFIPVHTAAHLICFVVLFEGRLGKKVVQYWFSVFYFTVIYTPIYTVKLWILPAFGNWLNDAEWSVVASGLASAMVFFAGIKIKKRKAWIRWIRSISWKYYFLGVVCAFAANGVFAFVKRVMVEWNREAQIFLGIIWIIVTVFLYGLGVGFAFVDMLRIRYKQESALKDEYLRMSKEHYDSLAEHMEEIRRIRHDICSHLNSLAIYLEQNEPEKAYHYLQEIEETYGRIRERQIDVGNDLVNAVIMNELQRRGKQIELVCEGILPENITISDFDLCTIFSNVISNCLEACGRLRKKEKRIRLSIQQNRHDFVVIAENPVEWDIDIEQLGNFTSKQDGKNHGYGIYQINNTVEKNSGTACYKVQDGVFRVELFFTGML